MEFLFLPLGSFINSMISLKMEVIKNIGPIGSAAVVVAALGAMASTVKIFASIMNGQNFSLWQIVKPLVVCILCGQFTLVVGILDIVPNMLTVTIARMCEDMPQKNYTLVEQLLTKGKEALDKSQNEKDKALGLVTTSLSDIESGIGKANMTEELVNSSGGSTTSGEQMAQTRDDSGTTGSKDRKGFHPFAGVRNVMNEVFSFFMDNTAGVFCRLTTWIMKFLIPLIIGAGQVFLCILAILGPFALAFSNFPGFSGFQTWITRYLTTSFWMPSAYIIYYIFQLGMQALTNNVDTLFSVAEYTGRAGCIALFTAVIIYSCFKVPTVAGYIVSAGEIGAGALGGQAINLARKAVSAAAGVGTGGASTVASKVAGVVK